MADGALAGWLVPSEFMDVNYGAAVKRYLLERVTLLHIHRFDPNELQFGDALVSSAVVWFRNRPPPEGREIRFTYGGTLGKPKMERFVPAETLRDEPKWTRYPTGEIRAAETGPVLADFFGIKRGIVTGSNRFFILPERAISDRGLPMDAFRPILPGPRHVPDDVIAGDSDGNPVLERRLFLLDPRWPEDEIRERHPELWAYLEEGKAEGVADRYVCRQRRPWYAHERRPPTPFVCTYLGRGDNKDGRPFRFILNDSMATAANVYLMLYPKSRLDRALLDHPELKRQVWECLNRISPRDMLGEGRVYGGGLHKLEPKELGNVPANELRDLLHGGQPRGIGFARAGLATMGAKE